MPGIFTCPAANLSLKHIQKHYSVDKTHRRKKASKNYRPCLAALETKEWGKTFQLNNWRESWPPLHQQILVAAADEVGLTSNSEGRHLFLAIPCFEDVRILVTAWEAEPNATAESTGFNQSAESARRCRFASNCIMPLKTYKMSESYIWIKEEKT